MLTKLRLSAGLAVAVVFTLVSVLLVPAASAQTVEEVKQRDQLIANQENLLNTYRCLFGVDTDVVPGGCANPDTVAPGVAPENPAQHDIEVRDGLIQSQEALLNVYRCRFDVDTEIVPGGCVDGAPAPVVVEEPETGSGPATGPEPLGPPPVELGFDPFYGKYLDAGGLPVLASASAADDALRQVKRLVEEMLGNQPDILEKFSENNVRVAVMAASSGITELPEFSHLGEFSPGVHWDERTRGGGVGPTLASPVVVIAEENLLCFDSDLFPFEDIFVHEFAHGILNMGVELLPGGREFRQRLEKAYGDALSAGLWADTYAGTNPDEYWAEGVQSWFNLNDPPGPIHNEINTRGELETYDPTLAALIQEVFGSATVQSSCHIAEPEPAFAIRGAVIGPDGVGLKGIGLWAWQSNAGNSGFTRTRSDGSFVVAVPSGSFTLDIHVNTSGECTFVGRYGPGGFTTQRGLATIIKIDGESATGIEIRLPKPPGELPFIEWCA